MKLVFRIHNITSTLHIIIIEDLPIREQPLGKHLKKDKTNLFLLLILFNFILHSMNGNVLADLAFKEHYIRNWH